MPTATEVTPTPPWTLTHKLVTAAVLTGLLVVIIYVCLSPVRLLFAIGWIALIVAWGYWGGRKFDARLDALARPRLGDSICTFAQDFDRRLVDPWVVRATWEELQWYLGRKRDPFPIRASDRIERDYGILPDDLDDLWRVVSRRAGHSLEDTERNPYYGKVETVGDLVRFTSSQPLQGAV